LVKLSKPAFLRFALKMEKRALELPGIKKFRG